MHYALEQRSIAEVHRILYFHSHFGPLGTHRKLLDGMESRVVHFAFDQNSTLSLQ